MKKAHKVLFLLKIAVNFCILTMVRLLTLAQFQRMFCLTLQRKQAKLVGEVTVNFQNFARAQFQNDVLKHQHYFVKLKL
ncbi:hypothetical protein DWQ65_12780 [Treponema phagedenis]|uniref:Uncharacterized protein n=1 Tax=Treponema phagedenis TaxID=162 RepID=A0AAE6M839_TREPH|nr:hypothetical protein HMPREF9554_02968 [Treponema phagedenis F0421]QEJ95553.1 hypothetical protein FUT79_10290 [Treponema phagedenis]QEJ98445.1 hypothetical protein FUT82_10855 [Treponema phagedenis]QEK01406.1 hypothetical protein FUT84_09760 [Treponema phagedenis]QEK03953.1 hypothetical protein FUT83_09165 [Treponema phagedenis]